jgi:hypothetical protein
MSTQAIEVQSHGTLQTQQDWYSADQVLKRVRAIQQLMEAVMKKDTHFGTIPGTKKPVLYKAGSEQILAMFRIAVDPLVEDLSTDDECRIRVLCRMTEVGSGKFLGAGIGEASSSEQKYKWRRIVSKGEWEYFKQHLPDRTRIRFFSSWQNGKRQEGQEEQIRTEVPDIRNTILKMAKKRAQIDATLTVTGCSDMFEQDLTDLPEELQEQFSDERQEIPEPIKKTVPKPASPAQPQSAPPPATTEHSAPVQGEVLNGEPISEKQIRMLFALQKSANVTDDQLKAWLAPKGITSRKLIPKKMFQEVIDWVDKEFKFHTRPKEQEEEF